MDDYPSEHVKHFNYTGWDKTYDSSMILRKVLGSPKYS